MSSELVESVTDRFVYGVQDNVLRQALTLNHSILKNECCLYYCYKIRLKLIFSRNYGYSVRSIHKNVKRLWQ